MRVERARASLGRVFENHAEWTARLELLPTLVRLSQRRRDPVGEMAQRVRCDIATNQDVKWMREHGLNPSAMGDKEFLAWYQANLASDTPCVAPRLAMVAYTDGGERRGDGGRGFVLLDDTHTKESRLVWGKIVLDPTSALYVGADRMSNTTGELTALAELLLGTLPGVTSRIPARVL